MSKTAILFPGQGSQALGMGVELIANYADIRTSLEEASDALGYDVVELMSHGPEEKLNRTDFTQPAILALSVAIYRHLRTTIGIEANVMAGHSLGEYSALVAAGVLDFADALQLVAKRGSYMLDAVPEGIGGMAAILGLDDADIEAVCAAVADGEVVSPVNYNSPGQVVIAGHKGAVVRASEGCLEKGAKKAIPLTVSGPFHSALMKPAAERLAVDLDNIDIKNATIDVVNNVDVIVNRDVTSIKDSLVRQIYNPVRWSETIQKMEADGVERYIECGPGKVLAGLNKRINRRSVVFTTSDTAALAKLVELN
ncbi:MAG: ACP S-malonyltransferase [Gammaproteobacteria bacterium]|nr:ACP S-malonyltransferase [Gammaproteobacteria bacterium]